MSSSRPIDPFLADLFSGNYSIDENGFRRRPRPVNNHNQPQSPSPAPVLPSLRAQAAANLSLPIINMPAPVVAPVSAPVVAPSDPNIIQAPRKLNHPLMIYFTSGRGSVKTKEKWSKLQCDNNPIAIRDQLSIILSQMNETKRLAGFDFGYGWDLDMDNMKTKQGSIIIFSYQTKDINFLNESQPHKLTHFTLVEKDDAPAQSVEEKREKKSKANKAYYKNKEDNMKFGESELRRIFASEPQLLGKLRKNSRAWHKCIYQLGVNDASEEEIREIVNEAMKAKASNDNNRNQAQPNQVQNDVNVSQMMQVMMMHMMQNMAQNIRPNQQTHLMPPPILPTMPSMFPSVNGYAAQRGNNNDSARIRYDPLGHLLCKKAPESKSNDKEELNE